MDFDNEENINNNDENISDVNGTVVEPHPSANSNAKSDIYDSYEDDYDDGFSAEDVRVNDFGNVSDEDYDTENDKESMRAFYVIAITVMCVTLLIGGFIFAKNVFPDSLSFDDKANTGSSQVSKVEPSVDDADTDVDDNNSDTDNIVSTEENINPSDNSESDVPEKDDTISSVDGKTELSASEIYASCVNSVVGITTEGTTTNIFGQVSKNASSGTGIIYSSDGYILTNYHVIESGANYTVTLYDGTSYKAELVGYEASNDVALLKIDATGLSGAYMGDSDNICVGEDIIVIGNPLGELTYTLTRGVVSALNRVINTDANPKNMFQIDAAVNSGNSGGPAFDACGRVIGIVTAKYSASTVEGIGFCIPINDAINIAEELKTYGYIRGKAGMEICAQDSYLTYGRGWFNSYAIYGAQITYIKADGAAASAGMITKDMIVEANGVQITSVSDLQTVLKTYSVRDKLEIVAYHSDDGINYEKKTYVVTLGEYSPQNIPDNYSSDQYGEIL
ncbi:MAG: trypsin-like peptidase domain-containing protein [Clostridia bacterium]|nr:trypsin-like peptidase domain-containing protein [Clostridia bacterium]MBQ8165083.1 trypsin-like peptidase domain-containing protein [Clostridia bacterium]